MAHINPNERFNVQFAEELTDIKLRMELMLEAINALDSAMRGTFELLIDQGLLPPEASGVKQYEKAMAKLRKVGLPSEKPKSAPQIACPGCRTMLRVAGNPGDRCEWCGHQF